MTVPGLFQRSCEATSRRAPPGYTRRTATSTDSFVPSDGRTFPPSEQPDAACGDRTLGKVADMQTKPTGSPVPGVIPEPIRVYDDSAARNRRDGVTIDTAPPRRRNPLARLLSRLRGDKYMVGAYPPGKER
jgi:hypothetical protein